MCETVAPIRKVSDILIELHEHETGELLHNVSSISMSMSMSMSMMSSMMSMMSSMRV